MAGTKGKSGRKANELICRQNLLIILDELDPKTDRSRMLNILHKLVEAAEDGKMDAINAVLDRIDGKPKQAVEAKVETGDALTALLGKIGEQGRKVTDD